MILAYYARAHWLSCLVLVNHWKRMRGLAPDEWYWADLELISLGHSWMPCYWGAYRFHGLLRDLRIDLRIAYLRCRIWVLKAETRFWRWFL